MPKIEIGLCPIRSHVDFTVLEGTHRSSVNIDRIKFLQAILSPWLSSRVPMAALVRSPLPKPKTTPPVTKIYCVISRPSPTGDLHPNLPLTKNFDSHCQVSSHNIKSTGHKSVEATTNFGHWNYPYWTEFICHKDQSLPASSRILSVFSTNR